MAQRVDVSRLSAMDWKRLRYGQGLGKRMRRSWPMRSGSGELAATKDISRDS